MAAEDGCGTYSPEVLAQAYAGSSDCLLQEAGEKPLWHGLPLSGVRQQIRFTFTDGHGRYTRVINFEQLADGSGTIQLRTLRPTSVKVRIVASQRSRRVTPADAAMIDRLSSSSGNWQYDIGSWDDNDIYLHCETLDMERVTAEGYSFSSVNISCNRPNKLMPLLQLITGLAGLKPSANGMY
jgi:hypothetical protein